MVLVGLDYGRKKTGVAVFCEGVVLPVDAVFGSWGKIRIRLQELSARYEGVKIVLGLPVAASGKPTELSVEVELFSRWLGESGFAVELINEVGSTLVAMQLLGKKDRKGRVDSLAACEILKRYLNLI